MAKIQAFRAWRPAPGMEEKIASPPYDVLNSEEARKMAEGNPYSFLHVIKPEIDLPENTDLYSDVVYATARENFGRMRSEGWLVREEVPSFYLYRQIMNGHSQIGLVAGASVREYENDLIKKHEFTRKKKEDDRTRHVGEVNANAGPVFLTYRASSEIDALVQDLIRTDPLYDFTAPDGIQHTVWVVSGEDDVRALETQFNSIPEMYVADGHHRSASAARVGTERRAADPDPTGEKVYDYFLAVMFPHDQLAIMDYNRVVKDLNGLTPDAFLEKVSEMFHVEPAADRKPSVPNTFGMYLGGKWYRLIAKPGTFPTDDPVNSLDVAILQNNLLHPILGIGDPRVDERIDFIGGIRGMDELERRVNAGEAVAFAMVPTRIEQLMAIADAGEVMPPKSTWFEPKLRSGLIVRSLEDI
ncbi:MAG TPA: DUF1015 family protein [bacterium]|nr:DUF1015 family protein [bacterium]